MARIIERVDTKYVAQVSEGIECDKCGSGWTNRTAEQPCDRTMFDGKKCTGTMHFHRREFDVKVPGYKVLECEDCHAHIHASIGQFTITCDCGVDYNGSGSRLADRSQWGEETGETADDILSVDASDTDALFAGD